METTSLILLIIFGLLFLYVVCKYHYIHDFLRDQDKANAFHLIDYMYSKTAQMQAAGKFKKTKKQIKKDKSPGTIFDWDNYSFVQSIRCILTLRKSSQS